MQDMSEMCKTVSGLRDLTFVIPNYQRGYRWTTQEVKDLLNDISGFDSGSQREPLFYYLQPLVVQKIGRNTYGLVDGQQRLTTIFIIIKFAEEEMRSAKCPYSLDYSTRDGSKKYLDTLDVTSDTIDDKNIDYYHISTARNTIGEWLNKQSDRAGAILDLYKRLMDSTRFIWYELPDTADPKVEFRKLNVGKIRLSNAELIKALLLSKDNFSNKLHNDLISKRQEEISIAWDSIEQNLQQPLFWSFINKNTERSPRIDLIFELIAPKYAACLSDPPKENDPNYSFLVLYLYMNDSSEQDKLVEEIWRDVEAVYDKFYDWYNDPDKYHLVGYLTHSGIEIRDILAVCEKTPKSRIMLELKRLAVGMKKYSDVQVLTNLDIEPKKRKELHDLLLLFNIATLICKSERQDRFPFDLFTGYEWDIEHIHAIKDKLPAKLEDAIDYLQALEHEFKEMLGDANVISPAEKNQYIGATNDLAAFLGTQDIKQKEADEFYTKLCSSYSDILQADNNIRNLTLLDSKTNRGYKNVSYAQKRREIIKHDQNGRFIPLCTRNVFLKYYSPNSKKLSRWEEREREEYKSKIASTISEFFSGVE